MYNNYNYKPENQEWYYMGIQNNNINSYFKYSNCLTAIISSSIVTDFINNLIKYGIESNNFNIISVILSSLLLCKDISKDLIQSINCFFDYNFVNPLPESNNYLSLIEQIKLINIFCEKYNFKNVHLIILEY